MKIALITGASRGIGRSIAKTFASAGYHVFAVAKTSHAALISLQEEIGCTPILADVSDPDQVTSLYNKIHQGTSLVVQWLRLHTPKAGGTGLIPGRRTKIPHAKTVWLENQNQKSSIIYSKKLFAHHIRFLLKDSKSNFSFNHL